jgi:uncharacterized membrane protein YphA (DoxX/SURF4 family)
MTIAILLLIGRIIFGIYWLNVAYSHFKNSAMLAGYAQSKGVKAPKTGVIGSGILALLGGLSILLGAWPRIGIALLVIFLIGVTLRIHNYWTITDPHAKQMDKVQFMKNVAIIGALLMVFAVALPWTWSI